MMEELSHLQRGGFGIKCPHVMFRFSTNEGVKTVRDRHFTNISIEIWVQSSNVYGFLAS